jgi:hypothetical protein
MDHRRRLSPPFTLSFREPGPPEQGRRAFAPVIHKFPVGNKNFGVIPGRERSERTGIPEQQAPNQTALDSGFALSARPGMTCPYNPGKL